MKVAASQFVAVISLLFADAIAIASPEVPGATPTGPIVLIGGTIHPVVGEVIEGGTLIIQSGKITSIGRDSPVLENAQRIDISGKHIYPGLLDAHTDMGLVEINSIRATIDSTETGAINPNLKSWLAVNPDSEIIPVTRSNGVLLTLTAPTGGLIAGRSAVIQLDGWTYEDLTLKTDIGLHINWPALDNRGESDEESPKPSPRSNPVQVLRESVESSRAYQKARASDPARHPVDLRWEAMLPVLEKKIPVIVTADSLAQIRSAIAFCIEQDLKMILHGGYDAADCADLLKTHDIAVIVSGVYRLPMRDSDPYDAPFTLPDRLRQAGIRYCISSTGKFGASGVRNLPYHAAMAAGFGLPADEALKSITLYPAQILGVSDRVGSLEVNKDATLVITTGDPLDTETQVEAAFIHGRPVDLSDRHKRLWKKYEQKYRPGGGK